MSEKPDPSTSGRRQRVLAVGLGTMGTSHARSTQGAPSRAPTKSSPPRKGPDIKSCASASGAFS